MGEVYGPERNLYLEAVLELLADEVEDDGVYAGVDCRQVEAKVIQDQEKTAIKRDMTS